MKIIFEKGDQFISDEGYGVVVSRNKALLIYGSPKSGWKIKISDMPKSARMTTSGVIPSEVQLVMDATARVVFYESRD